MGLVLAVLCMLSVLEVFCPETVKAGTYDDAYAFYQTYGNDMAFLPGASNQGEIYYATKAKKDEKTGIKYTTLGWRVRVFNPAGALVETLYYKLGGAHMSSVNVCTRSGYEYCLYRVTLTNMKERMSSAGLQTLNNPDCSIIFDACTTTKLNGKVQGGMTDEGPSWGKVYTTYNGIVHAQDWSSATKETLKSYYNKSVEGLFYDVTLQKGSGIQKVSGAGRYCFGTTVTVCAEVADGYHFSGWTGGRNSSSDSFSFVLYGSDVNLTANAQENTYQIVFDPWGGQGSIPTKTLKYSETLALPKDGFSMTDSTLSGWKLSNSEETITFLKGQNVPLKELVNQLGLQRVNGATIHLYAGWDYGPLIQTEAIYVSLEDAAAGKITEGWLAERAAAFDEEDGEIPYGQNETTSFFMEDYQTSDFTELQKEGSVMETFLATDSAGNTTRKQIQVHIVDTRVYPAGKFLGRVRFISKQYFIDENGNLVEEEKGGLESDSIWRLDEAYRSLLEELFQ